MELPPRTAASCPFFLWFSHSWHYYSLAQNWKKSRQGENTRKGPKFFALASETEVEEGITHTYTLLRQRTVFPGPKGTKRSFCLLGPLHLPYVQLMPRPRLSRSVRLPFFLVSTWYLWRWTIPRQSLAAGGLSEVSVPAKRRSAPRWRDAAPKSYSSVSEVTAVRKRGAGHWAISCACPLAQDQASRKRWDRTPLLPLKWMGETRALKKRRWRFREMVRFAEERKKDCQPNRRVLL